MLDDDIMESGRSLLSLCLDAATRNIDNYVEAVINLPLNLKSKLLVLVSKRGKLNSYILKNLVHPHIKILDLSESDVCDDSIHAITKCSQLYKLDLNPGRNQNRELSSSVLMCLFPNLQYLSVLYMHRCLAVTDDVTASIAINCPLLKELDIGGCTAVTDKSLDMLKNLKYLSSLNLSHSQVSDEGISTLVQGECGKSLVELRLDKCLRITDSAIISVVSHCTNLEFFIFHECHVSDASRLALETLLMNNKMKQVTWTIY